MTTPAFPPILIAESLLRHDLKYLRHRHGQFDNTHKYQKKKTLELLVKIKLDNFKGTSDVMKRYEYFTDERK